MRVDNDGHCNKNLLFPVLDIVWGIDTTHNKEEALDAHVGNSNREQIIEREEPNKTGKGALTPSAGPERKQCE